MKNSLLLLSLLIANVSFAAPLNICLNTKGELVASTACKKSKSKLTQSILSVPGPQGPAGPQGLQGVPGPAGAFAWQRCTVRTATISNSVGLAIGSLVCTPGEFLLTHGVAHSNTAGYVVTAALQFNSSQNVATSVTYAMKTSDASALSALIQGICCLP